ncbi:GNAT family N-acetyltransferase [Halomonas sp. BC04]|uniref:GNAT family N-acetyltransferase n=1 Tax=Halomonas sp. BC04 TaxID=1403540 RepID=UPI0003ED7DB5|nr:GNAT family N-acetyltransferase [Halomonas sp. BC04]EWH01482.1 hypothetical protein Q427_13745 [Halomonas sp. BC04]
MNIRNAKDSDLREISRLLYQINSEHHEHAPSVFAIPEDQESDYWRNKVNDIEKLFIAAQLDAKLVGLITATITNNYEVPFLSHHMVCRVGTIVVDVRHRHAGIGRLLMAKAEEWAAKQGANEIRLEVMEFNQRAMSFYANDGYETQSRIMSKWIV